MDLNGSRHLTRPVPPPRPSGRQSHADRSLARAEFNKAMKEYLNNLPAEKKRRNKLTPADSSKAYYHGLGLRPRTRDKRQISHSAVANSSAEELCCSSFLAAVSTSRQAKHTDTQEGDHDSQILQDAEGPLLVPKIEIDAQGAQIFEDHPNNTGVVAVHEGNRFKKVRTHDKEKVPPQNPLTCQPPPQSQKIQVCNKDFKSIDVSHIKIESQSKPSPSVKKKIFKVLIVKTEDDEKIEEDLEDGEIVEAEDLEDGEITDFEQYVPLKQKSSQEKAPNTQNKTRLMTEMGEESHFEVRGAALSAGTWDLIDDRRRHDYGGQGDRHIYQDRHHDRSTETHRGHFGEPHVFNPRIMQSGNHPPGSAGGLLDTQNPFSSFDSTSGLNMRRMDFTTSHQQYCLPPNAAMAVQLAQNVSALMQQQWPHGQAPIVLAFIPQTLWPSSE